MMHGPINIRFLVCVFVGKYDCKNNAWNEYGQICLVVIFHRNSFCGRNSGVSGLTFVV